MPDASQGFKTAIYSAFFGIIISSLLHALAKNDPMIDSFLVLFELLSIFVVIEVIENMTFWGIGYSLGYLLGIVIVGKSMMEPWEQSLLTLGLIVAILQKILRKLKL